MNWTDEKLDDLNEKVDAGFDRVDKRFERVEQRVERVDKKVDDLSSEMHAEFRGVRGEMKMLMAVMLGGFVSLFAAMMGVVATILTQV